MIFFHPLGRPHIREILAIQMRHLTKRLADRPTAVELSDTALDLFAESGFDQA